MGRSIRMIGVTVVGLALLVVTPVSALACGIGPMTFRDVITMSPLIIVAQVRQPIGTDDAFVAERVFKGAPATIELVPIDQMPVVVRSGQRVVLALMHPGISDGSGVTLWIVGRDGALSDAGITDGPRTLTSLIARLSAPSTSTIGDPAASDAGTGYPVASLAVAAIFGGVLVSMRMAAIGDRRNARPERLRRMATGNEDELR